MNFVENKNPILSIKFDDPNFTITDGIVIAKRAGFEFDLECPREHRLIIMEAIKNEWLKPVAHLTEREYMLWGLSK
jgi:hypothetical protein